MGEHVELDEFHSVPVTRTTKEIRVRPTFLDVVLGSQGNTNSCPIAKAVKRATGLPHVTVGGNRTTAGRLSGSVAMTEHDPETKAWIEAFDTANPIERIKMALNRPIYHVKVPR